MALTCVRMSRERRSACLVVWPGTNHEHDGVRAGRKHDGIGHGKRGRRVDDDVVVLFAQLGQHISHVGRSQQFGGIGRRSSGGEDKQDWEESRCE